MASQCTLEDECEVGVDSSTTEVTSNEELPLALPTSAGVTMDKLSNAAGTAAGKILLLFSGPRCTSGNLASLLETAGFEVVDFDTANGPQFDLVDDLVWEPLRRRIEDDEFLALVASPPCGTFSRARLMPGGPPPLRGTVGTDRYGLRGLKPQQTEVVRMHNLLAVRTAWAMSAMIRLKRIGIVEQPAVRNGEISMFHLDEFVDVMAVAQHTVAVQCPFGAAAPKKTSWLTAGIDFSDLVRDCPHEPKAWFEEGTGRQLLQPHPPARGRRRFFRTMEEACSAVNPSQNFVTSALAYYTPLLNRYLTAKIRLASLRHKPARESLEVAEAAADARRPIERQEWESRIGREQVNFNQPLRGTPAVDVKKQEELFAIGGLRDAAKSLKRLKTSAVFGRQLGERIISAVEDNLSQHVKANTTSLAWATQMCNLIGKDSTRRAPPDAVKCVRDIIVECTGHVDCPERGNAMHCTTDVDATLLESWRKAASDPDDAVCQWLLTGAPAGTAAIANGRCKRCFFLCFTKFICFTCLRSPHGL